MHKTTFEISKMDCPAEESLIRIKLQDVSDVKKLDFDLSNRTLTVYHSGTVGPIRDLISSLNLNEKILSSVPVDSNEVKGGSNQKSILWTVLWVNLSFFAIEMTTGIVSKSMGLVADSLDMLADSFVYGISLLAVTGTLLSKKQVAKIAGYIQIVLAVVGFVEVVRRFLGHEDPPNFRIMILVSLFALIANSFCLYILNKSQDKGEAHMKASMIFTSNDVIINLGVIAAGLLVNALKSGTPDLIIGAVVFILVVRGAFRILTLSK